MAQSTELTVYAGKCLAVGTATIEPDPVCREMLCIRLVALPVDGTISIPLADLLVAAQEARSGFILAASERVGHA